MKLPESFPNFLIIGAGKAGTSSLHHYLKQHPEIFMPKTKETHYFIYDDVYSDGPDKFVATLYKKAELYKSRGDATPTYFRHADKVIPRIKETYGNNMPKLILLLRDPVARAWSHYQHRYRAGKEKESFERALELESERIKESPRGWWGYYSDGLYAKQLKQWFKYISKENFLIIRSDKLNQETSETLKEIYQFLGVDDGFVLTNTERQNTARSIKYHNILNFMNSPSLIKNFIKKIVPFHVRQRLRTKLILFSTSSNTGGKEGLTLQKETELKLRKNYQGDIGELEELLIEDFSAWKN